MNGLIRLAVASSIAVLCGSSFGHADGLFMNDSPELERTLRSFDGRFDIQPYYNFDGAYPGDGPSSVEERTPSAVGHIQEAISGNKPLVDRLEQRGVDIRNIINVEQAADGSITFFTD